MKLRYLLFILIALLGVVVIYVFFPLNEDLVTNSDKPVKIFYVDNISTAHKKLINNFNKKHLGKIEVVPIDIPFYKFSTNERKELLIRSLRSESKRIDIFAADLIWVKRFAKWAEPLEKYFTKKELGKLLPKALTTGIIDSHFVASPFYMDVSVLFYRKDLLNRLPNHKVIEKKIINSVTWQEFKELHDKYKFGSNYYIFPADEYEGLICSYTDLVLSQDKDFFKGRLPLLGKASLKSVQLLSELTNKYHLSPKVIINFREKNAYKFFSENNSLFLRGWQSFKNDSKNLDKSAGIDSLLGEARLPHFKGAKLGGTIGGWNLMVAENSSHKKEAVEFIKYTLTEEAQKILLETGSYLPVISSIYSDSSMIAKHTDFAFNKKLLDEGFLRPKLPDYTKISDILSHNLRLAIAGKLSPFQAMKKSKSEIENKRIIR